MRIALPDTVELRISKGEIDKDDPQLVGGMADYILSGRPIMVLGKVSSMTGGELFEGSYVALVPEEDRDALRLIDIYTGEPYLTLTGEAIHALTGHANF